MRSYFKLTWLDFKKCLTMPVFYIMALILIASSMFLTAWFEPTVANSYPIDLTTTNAADTYNTFLSANYKPAYDLSIEESENFLLYFTKLNAREELVNQHYNNSITAFNDLENNLTSGDAFLLGQKISAFLLSLEQFKFVYLDFSELSYISFIAPVENTDYYKNTTANLDLLINQTNHYNSLENKAEGAISLVNYVKTNNFTNKLAEVNANSMKFMDVVLENLILELDANYKRYLTSVDNIASVEHFLNGHYANQYRSDLISSILDTKAYIEFISDSTYTIIYINKSLQATCISALNNAYAALNLSPENAVLYAKHKEVTAALKQLNLLNKLNSYNKEKVLINVSNSILNSINEIYYTYSTANATAILTEIDNALATNDNEKMIVEVNKYYLLSSEISNLIYYNILLDSTKNISSSKIKNFYGAFSNYNEYEYKTKLVLSEYCLKNNKYSIEFHQPFEFNTISNGTKSNSFDYSVFTVTISTLLITLFIIILAVKNITQESNRGTLKLTLVRPMSRASILFAKTTAITLTTLLLLIISIISSLLVGANYFQPAQVGTVLTIFNSAKVFTISNDVFLLVFYLFIFFELSLVVVFSVMFAIIFRKKTFAYLANLITLLVLFIIKIFLSNGVWVSFFPMLNANLYKYFTINNNFDLNILNKIFTTPIITNMNFIFSISFYLGYYIIFVLISNAVFKSRDY